MASPELLKEMPVQQVAGVACPVTLPWFYQIKAEPVSGGHTVEFYGTIATGAITLAATIVSLALAWMHMTHYSKPHQQKHIIRILWMVPIYTLISSVSTLDYPSSIYLQPFQQCYEAIALLSLFNLFCNYLAEGFDAQLAFFTNGDFKAARGTAKKPSGLAAKMKIGPRWYKVIVILVFQFFPVQCIITILTWITSAAGVYCATSTAPQFAHLYLFIISLVSLITCMVGIVYFYKGVKPIIQHHRPILQLACIKIIVALNAIQGEIIELLLSKHAINMNAQWTYGDITVMVPAWLLAVECMGISVVFWWAFSPQEFFLPNLTTNSEYGMTSTKPSYMGGFLGVKALMHAAWMWDLFKHCYLAFSLLPSIFQGRKNAQTVARKDSHQDFPALQPGFPTTTCD